VDHLIKLHLQGIPAAHLYDGQRSIYDLAKVFERPHLLREHFRCGIRQWQRWTEGRCCYPCLVRLKVMIDLPDHRRHQRGYCPIQEAIVSESGHFKSSHFREIRAYMIKKWLLGTKGSNQKFIEAVPMLSPQLGPASGFWPGRQSAHQTSSRLPILLSNISCKLLTENWPFLRLRVITDIAIRQARTAGWGCDEA